MKKLRQLCSRMFSQFPFFIASQLVLFECARRLFDRHCQPSYSQTGEDRLIDFYLSSYSGPQFYVDIGCHTPTAMSNTMRLYRQGWHGLCIDGNPDLISEYRRVRPRDISICACVSNEEVETTFTIPDTPAMSTLSKQFVEERLQGASTLQERIVKTQTAQSLFTQHDVPNEFALLTIDVEGHDFEVLTSFDLRSHLPFLIVIEIHGLEPFTSESAEHPICKYLSKHGYQVVAYSSMNAYFIRRH